MSIIYPGMPMGDKPLDVIAASESGECIRAIFDNPGEYKGKQVS